MWRGRNWKPSLPDLRDDRKEANKVDPDNKNYKALPSEALDVSAPNLHNNPAELVSNLSHDTSISFCLDDVTVDKVEVPCPTKNSKRSMSVIADAEITNVATDSYGEPEPCRSTSPGTNISHDGGHITCPSNAMSDNHEMLDINYNGRQKFQ